MTPNLKKVLSETIQLLVVASREYADRQTRRHFFTDESMQRDVDYIEWLQKEVKRLISEIPDNN